MCNILIRKYQDVPRCTNCGDHKFECKDIIAKIKMVLRQIDDAPEIEQLLDNYPYIKCPDILSYFKDKCPELLVALLL